MNYKHIRLCLAMLLLPVSLNTFGQTGAPILPSSTIPTVSISAAASGVLIRSRGASSASLDLGRVSYFTGTSSSGETRQKRVNSFVITTLFSLRVDCPGSPSSTRVKVTMTRADAPGSHVISVDGTPLRLTEQTLAQSMSCGSAGEHRLDLEVPVSTPSGPVGSTIAFLATLTK